MALALGGCGEDKPTVPFAMSASSAASAAPTDAATPAPSASSAFSLESGQPPSGDGRSFQVGNTTARARGNRVFKSGLPLDVDADGTLDLIAWTETKEGGAGELSYFHGTEGGAAETALVKLPKDLDLGRCSHEVALGRVSPSLVMIRVSAECGERGEKRETWLAFARVGGAGTTPEVRLEARAESPLTIDARPPKAGPDAHDVELVARLDGTKLEAPLFLYDKPAGFAWDPTEPEATLARTAAALVTRAGKKDAAVPEDAERLLELSGALCADLGTPSLTINAGPVPCGDGRFVGDAVHAVGLSALGADNPLAAANALDLLSRLPAAAARKKELEAKLGGAARSVPVSIVQRPGTSATKSSAPLAPLAWTESGRLMVQTDEGVVEVDPATGAESKSDAIAWPRGIAWRSGDATVEILGAERRCDPPARVVTATAKGSATVAQLPSIAARMPAEARKATCKAGPLPIAPLTVDPSGATLAVGGEVFRVTYGDAGLAAVRAAPPGADAPPSLPGSARSADGKAAVLTLGDGLLVLRPSAIERWTAPDLVGLSGCVVTAAGDRVACRAKSGLVIVAPRPGGPGSGSP